MDFQFTLVEKKKFGASNMPDDIVRVRNRSVSLAQNVGSEYESYVTAKGSRGAKIRVEYDAQNKALRLTRDENGWSFLSRDESAIFRLSGGAGVVRRGNIEVGDYVRVPGQGNVFVLAR